MRELARRLLAESRTGSGDQARDVELVVEKLRASLARFAGHDGFVALLRRALALASAEIPALRHAKVSTEGRLEGIDGLRSGQGEGAGPEAAAVAITTHLLGLLITFVGVPLTMNLVREAWPDTPLDDSQLRNEEER